MPYLAEFLGTAILILLGDGVVANVSLQKSGMKGGGSLQITIAWGLAVLIPAVIFGGVSGAHFNPALTLGLAITGQFAWSMVPGYLLAQIAGGFCGGCLVYLFYKDQFDATTDAQVIKGCFCTAPSVRHFPINFFCECIGTFLLVFSILSFGNLNGAVQSGVNNLYVFGLITSIGMSLGGTTGYAINPARDLGPRIAHAVLPIHAKGGSDWRYAWIPIAAPILGGILGAVVYICIFLS